MQKIGIISDTHSFIDEKLFDFLKDCDIVFHAGDIGDISVYDKLAKKFKIYAVSGNIDNYRIREFIDDIVFAKIESVNILMTHIGGYPGRYVPKFRKQIETKGVNMVITGHSHILKVIFDKKNNHLHINPGAYGKSGFHKVRTAIRLVIEGSEIKDLEILEVDR